MVEEADGSSTASQRQLSQTKSRIKKLHDVVLQMEELDNEQQVYDLGIEAAEQILELSKSGIDIIDDGYLVPVATSSEIPEGGSVASETTDGIIGLTYRTQQTYIIDNMDTHPQANPALPEYRALISVPIGSWGVFQCVSDQIGAFSKEDAEMLEILAAHIAAAVRRIRTQQRLEEKHREADDLASRYEMILQGTQDGMFLMEPTYDGGFAFQEANSAFEELIGHNFSEHQAVAASSLLPAELINDLEERMITCLKEHEFQSFELELSSQDRTAYFSIQLSPIVKNGETVQIVGSVRERTAEKEAQMALQESEEKYRTLVENAKDIIAIVQDRRYVYINPAVERILGYQPEEILGTEWLQQIHPEERENVKQISEARFDGQAVPDIYESSLLTKDDSRVHGEVNVNTITFRGSPAQLVLIRDISQRKIAENRLRYLSFHDQLTDLYNRAFFESELNRLDVPRQLPLSVVMADINGLKLINDAFGHQKGDRLLQKVSLLLKKGCREEDIVARIGGDEFAILLHQTSLDEAEQIISRLRNLFEDQKYEAFTLSVSLGAATKTAEEEDIWELVSEAEERMYRDKVLQRDSVRHSIIQSLISVLEEKTTETQKHIKRLQNMSVALGRELGLDENQLNNLELLAQLHDIGKVAVSNSTLLKQGFLTEEEKKEIQRHPEIGYRIARATPEFSPIAESILHHHEWYNGEGYLRGLAGEEIPLLARVLAVVDAYDAMTNDRPYREAMDRQQAIAEISENAGTQFDPEVVEAFLRLVSSEN